MQYYVETSQCFTDELASLFQMQKKLKACRNLKGNFCSSCFIAVDSQVKTVWLHVVVFSEHEILHFRDNVHLLKYYPVKKIKKYYPISKLLLFFQLLKSNRYASFQICVCTR